MRISDWSSDVCSSDLDYVRINEVIGRSFWAMQALGTLSLQDSLMVHQHGGALWRERYLLPMIAGDFVPSFAMTEPGISSSDPTQLQTRVHLEDGHWLIAGHKWFTTGAADARYTTVMCRNENAEPDHAAFKIGRAARRESVLEYGESKGVAGT